MGKSSESSCGSRKTSKTSKRVRVKKVAVHRKGEDGQVHRVVVKSRQQVSHEARGKSSKSKASESEPKKEDKDKMMVKKERSCSPTEPGELDMELEDGIGGMPTPAFLAEPVGKMPEVEKNDVEPPMETEEQPASPEPLGTPTPEADKLPEAPKTEAPLPSGGAKTFSAVPSVPIFNPFRPVGTMPLPFPGFVPAANLAALQNLRMQFATNMARAFPRAPTMIPGPGLPSNLAAAPALSQAVQNPSSGSTTGLQESSTTALPKILLISAFDPNTGTVAKESTEMFMRVPVSAVIDTSVDSVSRLMLI